VLAKQVTELPRPLSTVSDGTPRRLAQTIDKCLAKDRDDRPESAAALADQMGLALEQRKELPVPLRVFAKRGGRFGGLSALVYLWGTTIVAGFAAAAGSQAGLGLAGWIGTWVFGLTVVPFGVLVARTRRIANSGFTREDVVTAFKSELDSGSEERAYEYGRGPSHYERVMRWLSAAGLGTAALAVTLGSSAVLAPFAGIAAALGLMVGLPAGGLALSRLQRRRDLDTGLWLRIWRGPIGRLIFGRLRAFEGRPALPSGFTFRPTELVLGMAAERLFDELPKETREELRELPDVLRRLEHDAGRMRARLEELNDALQGAEERGRLSGQIAGDIKARRDRVVTDLEGERELVQRRLKDAVAALETIRLNLLKLHAGAGSVQSLTTDLTLARAAAQEVELLLEAHKEIDEAF
jgi:hypothetical protein